jgi:hypothetical protein
MSEELSWKEEADKELGNTARELIDFFEYNEVTDERRILFASLYDHLEKEIVFYTKLREEDWKMQGMQNPWMRLKSREKACRILASRSKAVMMDFRSGVVTLCHA